VSLRVETPTKEKESILSESSLKRIAARQAWETLTEQQQHRVCQALIQVCQELLRKEGQDEAG
jgi:hypothetical protein